MLDEDHILKLRVNLQMKDSCWRKLKCKKWIEYWVDAQAGWCVNNESQTWRRMCRKMTRVVCINTLEGQEQLNALALLSADGWELQWQVEDNWGLEEYGDRCQQDFA